MARVLITGLWHATPGVCTSDLGRLACSKRQRAWFPLDPAARWDGGPA